MLNSPQSPISPSGRRFLIIWSTALTLFFVVLGYAAVSRVNSYRVDATARHAARIDPQAVEVGRTTADDQLLADARPRRVTAGIYLDGITKISILETTWSPVMYVWFRWKGDDINPGETFKLVEGEVTSKEKLAEHVQDGEHYVLYLVKAQVTKFFDEARFPVDDHVLTIAIEDGGLPWDKLEYVPDTENSNLSSRVKMPGYVVSGSGLIVKPHTYKSNFGDPRAEARQTYSQLVYWVRNKRPGLGTYSRIFIGLFAAILISLIVFFIKPTEVDPRFGLGVGGFFGAVANTLLASSMVPDSGIMSLMDIVNGVAMVSIFLMIVQSTISLYIFDTLGDTALSRLFDRVSFVIFATCLVVINVLIPFVGRVA